MGEVRRLDRLRYAPSFVAGFTMRPTVIALTGLPGTGKSKLGATLYQRLTVARSRSVLLPARRTALSLPLGLRAFAQGSTFRSRFLIDPETEPWPPFDNLDTLSNVSRSTLAKRGAGATRRPSRNRVRRFPALRRPLVRSVARVPDAATTSAPSRRRLRSDGWHRTAFRSGSGSTFWLRSSFALPTAATPRLRSFRRRP